MAPTDGEGTLVEDKVSTGAAVGDGWDGDASGEA